jgi:hypothetical protein
MQYNKHMSIRIPYLCRIVGHKRDRKRAWFDGMDWRSNCIYCEISMIRGANGWRPFLPSDYSVNRDSKDAARLPIHQPCKTAAHPKTTANAPETPHVIQRGERRPGARDLLQPPEPGDRAVQASDPQTDDAADAHIRSEAVSGSTYRQRFITAAGRRVAQRRNSEDRYG